jgi:amidase
MTRTVRDAAHVLNVVAGRSESDDLTWDIPFDPIPDFTASCQSTDLSGVRIGVPRNTFLKVSPFVLAAFETALKTLGEAGADIVEDANFESADEWMKLDKSTRRSFCITAEFKSDLANYLSGLKDNPNNIHTLEELINFTKSFPEEEYPARDIDIFLAAQANDTGVSGAKYKEVREKELYFGGPGGILGALEKFDLDVLAIPSTIEIPTVLAAKMGYPILTVPLGFYPEGTEIKKNKRGDLIKIAPGMSYVQASDFRDNRYFLLTNIASASHSSRKHMAMLNYCKSVTPLSRERKLGSPAVSRIKFRRQS